MTDNTTTAAGEAANLDQRASNAGFAPEAVKVIKALAGRVVRAALAAQRRERI